MQVKGKGHHANLCACSLSAGLALMYLGASLLLSRCSAEAANIRADVNLLWTNKFDRCGAVLV